MEVRKINIAFCEKCNNWKGEAEEKYNGLVPVHCACTLSSSQKNGTRSPSMICPKGGANYGGHQFQSTSQKMGGGITRLILLGQR